MIITMLYLIGYIDASKGLLMILIIEWWIAIVDFIMMDIIIIMR